jgi:hypothetical protein
MKQLLAHVFGAEYLSTIIALNNPIPISWAKRKPIEVIFGLNKSIRI